MKKIIPFLLIISLVLNVTMAYLFFIKGDTVKGQDGRTAIKISADNKEFVLAEMRGFLESIQQINEGIANNDSQKIINAATKSGAERIGDAPQGLFKSLPLGFKSLGLDTHAKFDALAKAMQKNYNQQEAQKEVSQILSNCTACHRAYKFQVKP